MLVVGTLEIDPISGGAARIGHQYDVPARGQRVGPAAPTVDGLPGRTTVWKNDGGIAAIALEVERHTQDGSDDLPVEAFVMHQLRWRNRLWREAGHGHISKLPRAVHANVIHPQVVRRVHSLVFEKYLLPIGREMLWAQGRVDSRRQLQLG